VDGQGAGRSEARLRAKRRRARRGAAISAASTVVVLGGLAAIVLTSSGWHAFHATFLSWSVFKDSFPDVLGGFWLDVKLFVIVEAIVLALGLVVALTRVTSGPVLFPLRLLATVYTDVFRGIPTILLVYLVGFGIPALELRGVPADPVVLGGFALALSYSAYVAENYRAGIQSVHPSQRAAALSVGLTESQAMRHVILPQAVRRVVPPLMNDFIALQKDVALVAILGPQEAFRIAQIYGSSHFNYTPLLAAAVLYLCVTIPMARFVDHLQKRTRETRS